MADNETNEFRQTVPRAVLPAMVNGFLGRCPHCGEGRLFRAFLKTADACPVCHEELHHQRADDFPAYLVVLVVGHIVVGAFMGFELMFELSTWQHLAIWIPATILLAIVLIQPIKGAVVGLQWALRMHGFGGVEDRPEEI
jgi:uncharacterized protein (DUF983 family)